MLELLKYETGIRRNVRRAIGHPHDGIFDRRTFPIRCSCLNRVKAIPLLFGSLKRGVCPHPDIFFRNRWPREKLNAKSFWRVDRDWFAIR